MLNGASFVDSTTAMRLWRVSKQAGRPWPVLDSDDVIDFMVMEAVALKVMQHDAEEAKKQEQKNWKRDKEGLDKLREIAG